MKLKQKMNKCLFFVLLLFLLSCGSKPKGVLSEKEMVSLMVDMQLAEAYVNTQRGNSNTEREMLGKRVLEAHGVTPESLDTTLAWYGRNMDKYSELFDKVDQEILKRKDKYTELPGEREKSLDNLWPYGTHLVISPLSGHDSFTFSIPNPEIEKGDIIELSLSLPNTNGIKGTLGVVYTDGYGEGIITNSITKKRMEVSLQTDSSKVVSKIFGVMQVKNINDLPVYIDSISFKSQPLDTLAYRSKRRSQKTFGPDPI